MTLPLPRPRTLLVLCALVCCLFAGDAFAQAAQAVQAAPEAGLSSK